jgi:hypothetical protein
MTSPEACAQGRAKRLAVRGRLYVLQIDRGFATRHTQGVPRSCLVGSLYLWP